MNYDLTIHEREFILKLFENGFLSKEVYFKNGWFFERQKQTINYKYKLKTRESIGINLDGKNSLFELTIFAKKKGYELFPIKENNLVRACLFKYGKFIQEGKKTYEDWQNCQYETLKIILKK